MNEWTIAVQILSCNKEMYKVNLYLDAVETHGKVRGILLSFLTSALEMVSGHLNAPAALFPVNISLCPSCKRLGGPQSRYGPYGEENYFLFLPGINL
jgi:hypothetical protein